MLVDSTLGNPNVRATGNGAQRRAVKSRCHPPQKCPYPWGTWTPSNTQFHGSTRVHI